MSICGIYPLYNHIKFHPMDDKELETDLFKMGNNKRFRSIDPAPIADEPKSFAQEDSMVLDQDAGALKAILYEALYDYPEKVSLKIRRVIKRLRDENCPRDLKPRKLLMVGPSGVGKTTIAKAIAVLAHRPYVLIKAPQLLTRFQFSGAENITNTIKTILAEQQPCVIIVDEINCFFDRFKNEQQPDKETATALWLAIDECAARDDIFFIGITNEASNIPDQLKTRFANHMLEIPLPDIYARKRIMRFYLKNVRHGLTNMMLNELADKAHGLSARELEDMMKNAIEKAYDRNSHYLKVRFTDIEYALQEIRPHGRILTAIKKVWDNKKEIVKEAGPYVAVAGFALNVVQALVNEMHFKEQHHLNTMNYALAQDNYSLSKSGHNLQRQSHALGKQSFEFQRKCHEEGQLWQRVNHRLQLKSQKMQKRSLEWQDFDHSFHGRVFNFVSGGSWLGFFKPQ